MNLTWLVAFVAASDWFQVVGDGERLKVVVTIRGDEGDVVVVGVVLVNVHHDGLVAEGLFHTIDFHITEGVPAINFVAFLFFLVGVDEEIDPVAEGYVVGFRCECQEEPVAVGFNGGDFLLADVGEVFVGFLQGLFVYVVDSDDALSG